MEQVLVRAGAFIVVLFLGFFVKRLGLLKTEDFGVLSRVVLNITLPAVILRGVSSVHIETDLLLLIAVGMGTNLILIGLGKSLTRNDAPERRGLSMINMGGFNIGCFALPYIQGLLGPLGFLSMCLFDMGNSLMCTGGTLGLVSTLERRGLTGNPVAFFFKRTLSSVPFLAYLVAIAMSVFRISLPSPVLAVFDVITPANAFLSMFMIGVGLTLTITEEDKQFILRHLLWRYAAGAIFAALTYLLLPFEVEVRQTVAVLCLSPLTVIGAIFTARTGGDVPLANTLISLSTLVSLGAMTALMVAFRSGIL